MTDNLATYDFTPYRERVFRLAREKFLNAIKQNLEIDLQELAKTTVREEGLPPGQHLQEELLTWLRDIYHLDFLKKYLKQEGNKEIILHSNEVLQIQGKMREYKTLDQLSKDDFQTALEILAQKNYQTWNYAKPYCSFQTMLFDSLYRITLCHFCTTPQKSSKAFFRALRPTSFPLKSFSITEKQVEFFKTVIRQKKNIVIAGPTGSGKSSILRSLIEEIDPAEHIIILEDTYELVTEKQNITNLIALDENDKSLTQYCAYALRMKPDRLIVGEIRSSEVVPFLLASNSGHKGLMTSVHANSAADALSRLGLLFQIYSSQKGLNYQEVLKLVCQSIDLIVYCQKRAITEVIEVLGCEGSTPYFKKLSVQIP